MIKIFRNWIDVYFSDEEAVTLFLLLALGLAFVVFMGRVMAPVIASVIIAFVLQGLVTVLIKKGVNQKVAIFIAFTLFSGFLLTFLFVLLPLVWGQLVALAKSIPSIFEGVKSTMILLPEKYPGLISMGTVENIFQQVGSETTKYGQLIVSYSLESFPVIMTVLIYLVLVPILVFFFLKDKDYLLNGIAAFLPKQREQMTAVWRESNTQFANYIRGKVIEIFIVGGATYIAFALMGLRYTALISILVGFSVVIPYIGAVLITVPVAMIGLFQWGWGAEFFYLMFAHLLIQGIDGNILVPLLFSEVVNLHPVIIILAALFFGGIWGIWGVFFAIPLATLLKAVLASWPKSKQPFTPASE